MTLGPAIVLIIIAAIAGYVLGIVDSRMTASLKNNIQDKPDKTDTINSPEASKARSYFPGEHTVLRVSIDEALNWHCEIDGKRFDNPAEINSEQKQRALNVMGRIQPWLDAGTPISTMVMEKELVSVSPMPIETGIAASHTIRSVSDNENSSQPKINPMRGLRSILNNDVKSPTEKKGLSIVEMIDEVLQLKLAVSPFSDKNIHLEEGSQGEVIVHIGPQRFAGINEVADPEIQKIIKTAISDWERK